MLTDWAFGLLVYENGSDYRKRSSGERIRVKSKRQAKVNGSETFRLSSPECKHEVVPNSMEAGNWASSLWNEKAPLATIQMTIPLGLLISI